MLSGVEGSCARRVASKRNCFRGDNNVDTMILIISQFQNQLTLFHSLNSHEEFTHEQNTGSRMQTFGKKTSVAPVDRTGRGTIFSIFINK